MYIVTSMYRYKHICTLGSRPQARPQLHGGPSCPGAHARVGGAAARRGECLTAISTIPRRCIIFDHYSDFGPVWGESHYAKACKLVARIGSAASAAPAGTASPPSSAAAPTPSTAPAPTPSAPPAPTQSAAALGRGISPVYRANG